MYDQNSFIGVSPAVKALTIESQAQGVFDTMHKSTQGIMDTITYNGTYVSDLRSIRQGCYDIRYIAQIIQKSESLFPEHVFKGIEQANDDIISLLETLPKTISKDTKDKVSMNVQSTFRLFEYLFTGTEVSKGDMKKHFADQVSRHSVKSYRILLNMSKKSSYAKQALPVFSKAYKELFSLARTKGLLDKPEGYYEHTFCFKF